MATMGEEVKTLVLCGLTKIPLEQLLVYVRTPNFTRLPGTVEELFYEAYLSRKHFLSAAVSWFLHGDGLFHLAIQIDFVNVSSFYFQLLYCDLSNKHPDIFILNDQCVQFFRIKVTESLL